MPPPRSALSTRRQVSRGAPIACAHAAWCAWPYTRATAITSLTALGRDALAGMRFGLRPPSPGEVDVDRLAVDVPGLDAGATALRDGQVDGQVPPALAQQ